MVEEAAESGFRLILGVNSSLDDIVAAFTKLGYRVEGRGVYGDGGEHDPMMAAPSDVGLARGVQVASDLCGATLCMFAHDADPVYILCKE